MTSFNPLNVNIGGDEHDPFYRYQMPPITITQQSGRNHSNNTVITNLDEVAYALRRPVSEVLGFLKATIGTGVKYSAENRRATLQGEFAASQLQDVLRSYIDTFVLCGTCGDPGTHYELEVTKRKKRATLCLLCGACGARTSINCEENKVGKHILSDLSKAGDAEKAANEKKKNKKKSDKKRKQKNEG